ncbi:scarecrow-like protein 14 [Tripterygium wilfordii]|uniref:scarecrow-like protein 14 n=1 Tax=Tripterygium wilfordii TaxID=458696 RepID=UPI0018F7FB0C|nr:scarecrow-like protein 14 [Tripterygium wilfordii]
MVMDQILKGLYGSVNEPELGCGSLSVSSNQNLKANGPFVDQMHGNTPLQADTISSNLPPGSIVNQEGDTHEDFDFSDVVLKYITQILMEEDIEEKNCMYQEYSTALQATEKSFYELIHDTSPSVDLKHENQDGNYVNYSSSTNVSDIVDPRLTCDLDDHKSVDEPSQSISLASYTSGSSTITEAESVAQFKKGFEEASKFLPNNNCLFVDLESSGFSLKDLRLEAKNVTADRGNKHGNELPVDETRGKKNPHPEDVYSEGGRSGKQSAVYTEPSVNSAMFDLVLLNCGQESALREALQNGRNKNVQQNGQSKGSNEGKARRKKPGGRRDAVDLRILLTMCAQAVSTDDRRSANDLLMQIRQHSSPTGDGMQRMACYFADGLEARLAGSGTKIYKALITKPTSAADVLKAYQLYLAACPFKKLSNFFSNKTIMIVAEKATKLHIIDFGILYGFQWPVLIQRLSSRPGGSPKLRITGIDFPQPGFRPAERVEETGSRLAKYAAKFKVPFKFDAIAKKWATIQIEDLKIDKDEVLVVNSIHRLRNLLDETVIVESPRNIVLNLITKMNPDVFILGTVNGAYSAPFFISRFREALFHFSTLFDMLETNVPRDIPERTLLEKEIFGWEAMNVIACEGAERIERPEKYKQWRVRNLRAGLIQLPLDREIVKIAKEKVNSLYHRDFVIDEDSEWLLHGWKGRIVYALSCWRSASLLHDKDIT